MAWVRYEAEPIATVERGPSLQIRIEVMRHAERVTVAVREFAKRESGEWHPQRQAIHCKPCELPDLLAALERAAAHLGVEI